MLQAKDTSHVARSPHAENGHSNLHPLPPSTSRSALGSFQQQIQTKKTPPNKNKQKITPYVTPYTSHMETDLHLQIYIIMLLSFPHCSFISPLSLHFLSCHFSIQVSRVQDISGHPNIPICPGYRWHSDHYTWQQQSLTHLAVFHQRGRQQAAARHSTTWDLGSYRHHKMHFGILSGQISDPTHLHCSFSLGVCFQCSR